MPVIIGIGKSAGGSGPSATVPLDALAQDGVPPEQGDKVSFSVDATVTGVSGSSATLKIDAVDGQPISAKGGSAAATESETGPGETPTESESGPGEPAGGPPPGLSEGATAMGNRLKKKARGQPLPLM